MKKSLKVLLALAAIGAAIAGVLLYLRRCDDDDCCDMDCDGCLDDSDDASEEDSYDEREYVSIQPTPSSEDEQ